MKTLKFSSILCFVLAFIYCNANAQKPLVENHDNFIYTIYPSPDLPCLTEIISGNMTVDGFLTNSSGGVTYHEKGLGTLTGATTGDYEMNWNFNCKLFTFDDGSLKNNSGMALSQVWHNGKLFMTINWRYHQIWTNPYTDPIQYFEIWEPKCQ